MKENTKLPSSLLQHTPWENHVHPIWPASIFVLHRNLSRFSFPGKMNESELEQALEFIKEPLLKLPELQSPLLLRAESLSPLDKEFIFEHFLCPRSFQNTMRGQGFVLDESARFLSLLNIEDHIQLQLIDCGGSWETTWNTLSEIETKLGSTLNFAFSPRFGYLTADPGLCGTGLEVFVYLHLAALSHTGQLAEVFLKQKEEEVAGMGMQGTMEEFVGDFLILTNRYSTGLNEETILRTLYSTAMKLMSAEKNARTKIQQENNGEIKDQISRAFGLLVHSFQLQTKETLSALSLIKLGIDLGWVQGISDKKINEIFFKCRRAHLAQARGFTTIDKENVHRARAEYLHKELQGVSLTY